MQPNLVIPPVGAKVRCWFLANTYTGVVVRHNRNGHPVIRFALKNGKIKEGRASVYDANAQQISMYKGYLAQLIDAAPEKGMSQEAIEHRRTRMAAGMSC